MKLSQDISQKKHQITSFDKTMIGVDEKMYHHSILISPQGIQPWPISNPSEINEKIIASILSLNPSLIILGLGNTATQINPSLVKPCHEKNIGVEIASTQAACWTYMTLLPEIDNLVVALMMETKQ